jgi:hypothetical protein
MALDSLLAALKTSDSVEKRLEVLDQFKEFIFNSVSPSWVFERFSERSPVIYDSEPGLKTSIRQGDLEGRDPQQPAEGEERDPQQPAEGEKRDPQQIEKADGMTEMAFVLAGVLAGFLGTPLVAASQEAATDGDEGASQEIGIPEARTLEQILLSRFTTTSDTTTDGEERASQEQVALASDTTTDGDEGASHSEQVAVTTDITTDGEHSEQVVTTNITTDGEHSEQVAVTSDAATDDEGASQEQVAAASDTATDSDEGASQEQVAIASDTATVGDEVASHSEQVAIVSDAESGSINYAAVMETAKAEVGVNPTLDDQAGPPGQPAASAVFSQEDSLSFSAFAKQGTPAEVANQGMPGEFAKQGMPADQLPAEAISTPGAPAGESAHHEVGSEDVGNAAPSKEPVVHHGDLTP